MAYTSASVFIDVRPVAAITMLTDLLLEDILCGSPITPLIEARIAELADSIDRVSLLQPLVVVRHGTRNYRLLAGRHRLAAVKLLTWATVPCVVLDLDHVQQQLAEVDENLIRRSLTYLDRAELIERRVRLLEALGHQRRGRRRKSATVADFSTAATARDSCLSPRSIRLAVQIVNGLPTQVRDQIRTSKVAGSPTQLLALARLPAAEQKEVARLLASGRHRRVGAASVEARRNLLDHADLAQDGDIVLHVGDFRSLRVKPCSARLVLTDPPWGRDWLENWPDLAAWSARALAPGGFLACYAGISYLPQVMAALGRHLEYAWTLACQHTGEARLLHHNRVMNGWQPVLLYCKGQPGRLEIPDFLARVAKEKTHHEWQQCLYEAEFLVERLTRPGDLVVDGCLGSGTVAVACQRLGRRFIGGDIDSVAVQTARTRVEGAGPRCG